MRIQETNGPFCIKFTPGEGAAGHAEHALDWGWVPDPRGDRSKRKWTVSYMDSSVRSRAYEPGHVSDEYIQAVLLEFFGLVEWIDDYPAKDMVRMSPKDLAFDRRAKETEFGLERLPLINNRMGARVPADEYTG